MVASLEKINKLKEEFKPGTKFFNWTVLEYKDSINILCQCDCGNSRNFFSATLRYLVRPTCGACRPTAGKKKSKIDGDKITELYNSGLKVKEISLLVGSHLQDVRNFLAKIGHKPLEDKVKNNQTLFDAINADIVKREQGLYFIKCRKCYHERGVSITHIHSCPKCRGTHRPKLERIGEKFATRTIIEYKSINDLVYSCECGYSAKSRYKDIKNTKYGCVKCWRNNNGENT